MNRPQYQAKPSGELSLIVTTALFVAGLTIALALVTPVAAQQASETESSQFVSPRGESSEIICVSDAHTARSLCPLPANPNEVALVRSLTHIPCIYGETWGLENQMLWTASGCAASFKVRYGEVLLREEAPESQDDPVPAHPVPFRRDA